MNCLQKSLLLLIPSLLLTSSSWALTRENEEILLDSLVDVIGLKDDCISIGSGFYYGDDITVVSVEHILVTPKCGTLTTVIVDTIDKNFSYGATMATGGKDRPILITVMPNVNKRSSAYLTKRAAHVKRGEKVYIPVIDFDAGTKSIKMCYVASSSTSSFMIDGKKVTFHMKLVALSHPVKGGSSGSPVVNENLEVVGVVVGGTNTTTFLFPVSDIKVGEDTNGQ